MLSGFDWKRQVKIFLPVLLVFSIWHLLPFKLTIVTMRSVNLHAALYLPGERSLRQGDYALFRWQGDDPQGKGLKDGMILLKRVACGPGQRLKVTPVQFFCDGQAGEFLRLKDSKGRPVRPFLYNGIIPQGKYFMIGDNPLSYDSRYWGFIDKNQIVGKVIFGL